MRYRLILMVLYVAAANVYAQATDAQGVASFYLEPNEADIEGGSVYLYADVAPPGGSVQAVEVEGQSCLYFPDAWIYPTRFLIDVPPHALGSADLLVAYADDSQQSFSLKYVDQPYNVEANLGRHMRNSQRIGGNTTFAPPAIVGNLAGYTVECADVTRPLFYWIHSSAPGTIDITVRSITARHKMLVRHVGWECSQPSTGPGFMETFQHKTAGCASILVAVGVEVDEASGANTPGGEFILETTFTPSGPPIELNDDPETAIHIPPGTDSYGPAVEFYCASPSVMPDDLGPHGVDLWYSFDAEIPGSVLAYSCYPDPPVCSPFRFGIYDGDLHFVGAACTTGPEPSMAQLPVPEPGRYYLRVEPANQALFTYVGFDFPTAASGDNGSTPLGLSCNPEYLDIEGEPNEFEGVREGGLEAESPVDGEGGEGFIDGATEREGADDEEGGADGEGTSDGHLEGEGEIDGDGTADGEPAEEGEGTADGEGGEDGEEEGEPLPDLHDADTDEDGTLSLTEVLRVIQLFNAGAYHCNSASEDGYRIGTGTTACRHHTADYDPTDWKSAWKNCCAWCSFTMPAATSDVTLAKTATAWSATPCKEFQRCAYVC